jgi:hypothetical protein
MVSFTFSSNCSLEVTASLPKILSKKSWSIGADFGAVEMLSIVNSKVTFQFSCFFFTGAGYVCNCIGTSLCKGLLQVKRNYVAFFLADES